MSNLVLRTLTAVVLGAVTLWMTWIGGAGFAVFSWIIGAAVLFEWSGLTRECQTIASKISAWVFYIALGYVLFIDAHVSWIFSLIVFGTVVSGLAGWRHFLWCGGGFLYASLPAACLALLRGSEPFGFGSIIFLFAIVWGTDIAAYFNGRALGGPKLAPRLSPNKTWSGAVGGTLAGVAGGVLVSYLAMNTMPANLLIPLLALALSVISQMGDIAESAVKRHFNVKDSGSLLPGHGGFMDRVDGLVCAAVLLYLVAAFCGEMQVPSNIFNRI